jgi:hypothetical protein
MKTPSTSARIGFISLFFSVLSVFVSGLGWGQGNTCATATAISGQYCSTYTVPNAHSFSGVDPVCVGNITVIMDSWFVWTPDVSGYYDIDMGGGGGATVVALAMYTGTCGDLETYRCANANDGNNTPETINPIYAEAGENYYFQLLKVGGNNNGYNGTFCITKYNESTTNTCAATFYDPGGPGGSTTTSGVAGNYPNNAQYIYTYCSNDPLNPYVTVDFTQFSLESGPYDFLTIHDGSSFEDVVLGIYNGNNNPGTLTSSSGCLTFYFTSDVVVNRLGWEASITCTNVPGVLPDATFADCLGAIGVCSDAPVSLNGLGSGNFIDLNQTNQGCLRTGEHNTVWYFVTIEDANGDGVITDGETGTFGFTIIYPPNQDYDYAVWGPLDSNDPYDMCPPPGPPTRCSYSANSGNSNTTIGLNSTSPQVYEGASTSEDGFVYYYDNVQNGETYLILIDKWGNDNHTYTLNFFGTSVDGPSSGLDCTIPTPLPVTLVQFNAVNVGDKNFVYWTTASEKDNDYFTLEQSDNGYNWRIIATLDGAGTSSQMNSYNFYDINPVFPITYYRLKQTDFDGTFKYSEIISVEVTSKDWIIDIFPNPASDQFSYHYNGKDFDSPVQITIIDMMGRLIYSEDHAVAPNKKMNSVDVSHLSEGLYKVSFTQGEKISQQSLLIQR